MSYYSNKKKIDNFLDIIESKIGRRVGIIRELREFLRDKVTVWIYTEAPQRVRDNYDSYIDATDSNIYNFRGTHFGYQYLRAKNMGRKEKHSKSEFIIHNLFETEESAAWVFLHEVMHAMIHADMHGYHSYLPHAIHSMNWVHEDRIEIEYNNSESYEKLYRLDEIHERNPEEQFCNLYATSLIGINYDRHWWRANMAPKLEE